MLVTYLDWVEPLRYLTRVVVHFTHKHKFILMLWCLSEVAVVAPVPFLFKVVIYSRKTFMTLACAHLKLSLGLLIDNMKNKYYKKVKALINKFRTGLVFDKILAIFLRTCSIPGTLSWNAKYKKLVFMKHII